MRRCSVRRSPAQKPAQPTPDPRPAPRQPKAPERWGAMASSTGQKDWTRSAVLRAPCLGAPGAGEKAARTSAVRRLLDPYWGGTAATARQRLRPGRSGRWMWVAALEERPNPFRQKAVQVPDWH